MKAASNPIVSYVSEEIKAFTPPFTPPPPPEAAAQAAPAETRVATRRHEEEAAAAAHAAAPPAQEATPVEEPAPAAQPAAPDAEAATAAQTLAVHPVSAAEPEEGGQEWAGDRMLAVGRDLQHLHHCIHGMAAERAEGEDAIKHLA